MQDIELSTKVLMENPECRQHRRVVANGSLIRPSFRDNPIMRVGAGTRSSARFRGWGGR